MINVGYWITPTGDILDLEGASHIGYIIQNPDVFGLTDQEIAEIYDEHDERLYLEGKAREEIIKYVVSNNFIRIRLYPQYWSITLHRLTNSTLNYLSEWSAVAGVNRWSGKYMTVRVLELEGDKYTTFHIQELQKASSSANN